MARSVKKGPYINAKLLKKLEKARASSRNEVVKTYARSSVIPPSAHGITVAVHNGRKFIPVLVTENMVGHKFGEFAPTRVQANHGGDKASKK